MVRSYVYTCAHVCIYICVYMDRYVFYIRLPASAKKEKYDQIHSMFFVAVIIKRGKLVRRNDVCYTHGLHHTQLPTHKMLKYRILYICTLHSLLHTTDVWCEIIIIKNYTCWIFFCICVLVWYMYITAKPLSDEIDDDEVFLYANRTRIHIWFSEHRTRVQQTTKRRRFPVSVS